MGLLTALLLGGMTYATYKRTSDNRVTKDVINLNIKEAEDLIARIDRNMDAAVKQCDRALELLYEANKGVYETTFPRFVAAGSQIMNMEFDDRQEACRKLGKTVDVDCLGNLKMVNNVLTGDVGTAWAVLGCLMGAGLLVQTVYSVKLKATLAEAKMELAKVQAVVEVAKREIAKMRSITTLADTATATVKAMQVLTDGAISELEEILNNYGVDYRSYPEDVKDRTWLAFKMVSVLNELVNMQILTPSGAISGKFRKFVGDINLQYLEK